MTAGSATAAAQAPAADQETARLRAVIKSAAADLDFIARCGGTGCTVTAAHVAAQLRAALPVKEAR